MKNNKNISIGNYLLDTLKKYGAEHIFGVPGDYILDFFDLFKNSPLKYIGCCNELNAGYAADGYARINGLSAVAVTSGPGAYSVANAVAGAYSERVPLVIISGNISIDEIENNTPRHHFIKDYKSQLRMFKDITTEAIFIDTPQTAAKQIPEIIEKCKREKLPVYIELPMNIVDKIISHEHYSPILPVYKKETDTATEDFNQALNSAAELINKSKKCMAVAGVDVNRLNIENSTKELIKKLNIPYATTIWGKGVLPENINSYAGIYAGKWSNYSAESVFNESDLIIRIGTKYLDVNSGWNSVKYNKKENIILGENEIFINSNCYKNLNLKKFLEKLINTVIPKASLDFDSPKKILNKISIASDNNLTITSFYKIISQHLIKENSTVISDTGAASGFGSFDITIKENSNFINQTCYMSIGYSVPSACGASLANPLNRTFCFVGDGAFQMTGPQAVSTMQKYNLNCVVFILNNKGYTVERLFKDGHYNDLADWNYSKLTEITGGLNYIVRTNKDMTEVINYINQNPDKLILVEVILDKMDAPGVIAKMLKMD